VANVLTDFWLFIGPMKRSKELPEALGAGSLPNQRPTTN
jgi:hypothetical protein